MLPYERDIFWSQSMKDIKEAEKQNSGMSDIGSL